MQDATKQPSARTWFDTEEDELVSLTELHTVPVFNIADAKGPTGSRKPLRKLVIVGA